MRKYFRPAQMQDPRFRYLFDRLRRSVDLILRDVVGELAVSQFTPRDFELRFGLGPGELPPLQAEGVSLGGVADRVDGWVDGDTLYLCVADYKTGRRTFSLTDVWYGLGIQMLLYLFALEENGAGHYGTKNIVPAGVLYAPARDVLLRLPRSSTPEEIQRQRRDALRRSGLLLADPRVLQAREEGQDPQYLPVKYKDGEPALRSGSIQADPLCRNGSPTPCDWCPYAAACAFTEGEDRLRRMRKKQDEDFWLDLGKEGETDG